MLLSNVVYSQDSDYFKREEQKLQQEINRQQEQTNREMQQRQMQQMMELNGRATEEQRKIAKNKQILLRGQLEALKNGVLIFRLKTNDKAVKKLEGILNNPKTKESSKQRIRERTMPDLKATTKELNDKLIRAFAEGYDFSAIYFMPNTCTDALQKNASITCLTDAQDNTVSGDVLEGKTIFLADFSELENNTTSRIKGLIIRDKNAEILSDPFPYFQRSGGVFTKLSSKNISSKDALKMVSLWNDKLHSFFEKK